LLHVDRLSFGFTNKPLIDRLNFEARPGEIWLIVGPNGAGKSTLMTIIAGLRTQNSGSVSWRVDQATKEPKNYSEYLSAEANGHFLKLDAETNLQFWSRMRRGRALPEPQLSEVLSRWRLDHPLVRRGLAVEKFSTGMKRRLAMARLEANAAPLWLLDEPLFGLDQHGVHSFVDMLRRHQAAGGISLVISHDLNSLQTLTYQSLEANKFKAGS
jgi:heme ABC exporter ATP-binding subunit CcmA